MISYTFILWSLNCVKLSKQSCMKIWDTQTHLQLSPQGAGPLYFTQPQSSGFILCIAHLKKFTSAFGGHLHFVNIPHIRRFLHPLLQSGRGLMFISRQKPLSTLIFFISYIDLMIIIASVTSALPHTDCGKNQVNRSYVPPLLWLCTDMKEIHGSQHQGHCKHGRAYPTFLFHGCVMTSPHLIGLWLMNIPINLFSNFLSFQKKIFP